MSLHDQYPKGYDAELGEYICDRFSTTILGMESILAEWEEKQGKAPSVRTIRNWLRTTPEFRDAYEEAKSLQAQLLKELSTKEALTPRMTTITIEDPARGTIVRTQDNVERSKLICYNYDQRAKQLAPKEYGDKAALELTGSDGGPIQTAVVVEFVKPNGNDTSS